MPCCRVLKSVRGEIGGGASKSWRLKAYVRHQATYPCDALTGRGASPPPPELVEEGTVHSVEHLDRLGGHVGEPWGGVPPG